MNTFWQRLIIFFVVGLPITWENMNKYWWAVILWVALLIGLNILLYGKMVEFKNTLDIINSNR